MFNVTKHITALLIGLLAVGLFFVSPAGAETGPELGPIIPSPTPQGPVFLPGGDGIFEPDGPIVVFPLFPSASVAVSCTSETATVTVKNPSFNSFLVTVKIDGSYYAGGQALSKQQWTTTFPLQENQSKTVKVTGSSTLMDKEVTRDCLLPAPTYQVLSNCDTEQAHARLINNGDDTAMMAVQYGNALFTTQPVAAHSSKDWLLDVAPGESASFTVRHGAVEVGSETLDFECEPPTPEGPATPETPATPATPATPESPGTDSGNTAVDTNTEDTDDAENASVAPGGTDTDQDGTDEAGSREESTEVEVLGEVEQVEVGDIDEIVSEVAGPAIGSDITANKSGFGFLKIAMIGLWILVLLAGGVVAVAANHRRAQTA